MELFTLIALSANVLLTAICAYCLSIAITKNIDTPETRYLRIAIKIIRKCIIVGGVLFMAFSGYSLILMLAMGYHV